MTAPQTTTADTLFNAAWNGELDVLQSILNSGAPLPPRALSSALEAAAYNAQPDTCDLLLENGADPNTFHEPTHETVLHQVITKTERSAERTRIVRALLAHGADVNRPTIPNVSTECFMRDIRTRGETPLHRAAAYGNTEMIAALLAAGADRSAKDSHGESPLTWASWHLRDVPVLKMLLYGEFEGTLR